jgi:uncharacterized protein (DUF1778 family)
MPLRKTAIALPEDLLDAVDRAAAARQQSRNHFITCVLRAAVRARRDAAVTRRLDELFADDAVAAAQRAEATSLDAVGTGWSDEPW